MEGKEEKEEPVEKEEIVHVKKGAFINGEKGEIIYVEKEDILNVENEEIMYMEKDVTNVEKEEIVCVEEIICTENEGTVNMETEVIACAENGGTVNMEKEVIWEKEENINIVKEIPVLTVEMAESSCPIAIDTSGQAPYEENITDCLARREPIFLDTDSDSESDSSSDSVSSLSSFSSVEDLKNTNKEKTPRVKSVKTRGELGIEDLPPVEQLTISVPEEDVQKIGTIYRIVDQLVVIESFVNSPPLDVDSVLFLSHGKPLGNIFEVFGPVKQPYYLIRFNSNEEIVESGIAIGDDVFYAPSHNNITTFIFTDQLMQQRGSDASWMDNNEPPDEHLDFSDDEQERAARRRHVAKNRKPDEAGEDTAAPPKRRSFPNESKNDLKPEVPKNYSFLHQMNKMDVKSNHTSRRAPIPSTKLDFKSILQSPSTLSCDSAQEAPLSIGSRSILKPPSYFGLNTSTERVQNALVAPHRGTSENFSFSQPRFPQLQLPQQLLRQPSPVPSPQSSYSANQKSPVFSCPPPQRISGQFSFSTPRMFRPWYDQTAQLQQTPPPPSPLSSPPRPYSVSQQFLCSPPSRTLENLSFSQPRLSQPLQPSQTPLSCGPLPPSPSLHSTGQQIPCSPQLRISNNLSFAQPRLPQTPLPPQPSPCPVSQQFPFSQPRLQQPPQALQTSQPPPPIPFSLSQQVPSSQLRNSQTFPVPQLLLPPSQPAQPQLPPAPVICSVNQQFPCSPYPTISENFTFSQARLSQPQQTTVQTSFVSSPPAAYSVNGQFPGTPQSRVPGF